ncbi:MAG: type IX secretion system membrane protein PorP/SprF [Chitinophagaceae bacterium]|jgi:hypothetical protein
MQYHKEMSTRIIKIVVAVLFLTTTASSQDIHFADVGTMNILNNQALKLQGRPDFRLGFRDIKYQTLSTFRTAGGLVNVPIRFGEGSGDGSDQSFLNVTLGGMMDKTNKGVFKSNTGMIGMGYAQRLTDNNLFLSVGFQGAFSRTTVGGTGFLYPDQFNQYGQLPSQTQDPLGAGRNYNWLSLNAGLSVFQNLEERQWYVGASVRHINRPFTDELKTETFRILPTYGVQAGMNFLSDQGEFMFFGLGNWKAAVQEYVVGGRIIKYVSGTRADNNVVAVGVGLSMRVNDALIPNILLRYNNTNIGIFYDVNVGGIRAAGFRRQGFEFTLSQTF